MHVSVCPVLCIRCVMCALQEGRGTWAYLSCCSSAFQICEVQHSHLVAMAASWQLTLQGLFQATTICHLMCAAAVVALCGSK